MTRHVCMFVSYLQWSNMHRKLRFILATRCSHLFTMVRKSGDLQQTKAGNQYLLSRSHTMFFYQNASWSSATSAGNRTINGSSWFSKRPWYWPRASWIRDCLPKKHWMEFQNLVCKFGFDQGLWSCCPRPIIPSIGEQHVPKPSMDLSRTICSSQTSEAYGSGPLDI